NGSEFGFTPTQNYSYRSGAHHPGIGTIVILLSSAGPPLLQRHVFAGGPTSAIFSENRKILRCFTHYG
ncbi:MAG: hypothetical protein ABSG56_34810, partial [Bryobacteraceae bacterium]